MAKLSKKSRRPESPGLAVEPAPRVAPRLEAADQRSRILERLTRVEKLGVRQAPQIIAGMLESREIDPRAGFVRCRSGELDRYRDFAQARIPAPPEPLPPRLAAPARQLQLTNSTRGEAM